MPSGTVKLASSERERVKLQLGAETSPAFPMVPYGPLTGELYGGMRYPQGSPALLVNAVLWKDHVVVGLISA